MPADWEPAPPSAELRKMAATFRTDGKAQIRRADMFDRLAADVAAMERRLAEYARKERADAE